MASLTAPTAQATAPSLRWWLECITVLCLSLTFSAVYAIRAGQDRNWDQRNYHIYSVYAWLHGDTSAFAPAQIQTWLNPLPHLPQYLLITHAPPMVAGAAMGAIAGINGLLLWMLIRRLQGHDRRLPAVAAAALALVLGSSGSLYLSFLGTTFAEYLCSPLVLGSLVALTRAVNGDIGARRFALAGVCLGAACGLKLTNLIYALGMSAALIVLWPSMKLRLAWLAAYAAGGIAGALLVGGYWAGKLWLTFGNPMFPFYNAVFESPWFASVNFIDRRFLPSSFVTALVSYPFAWLLGRYPSSELPFREPRFAFVAVLLPLAVIVTVVRSRRARTREGGRDLAEQAVSESAASSSRPHPAQDWRALVGEAGSGTPEATHRFARADAWNFWLCALFSFLSFAIWLKQFGIQRYALPLELMTGVLVLLSLDRLLPSTRARLAVLSVATLFALVWTRPPDWERMPYGTTWFGVAAPAAAPPMLYVMIGGAPMAYTVPFLPRDRFVRIGGNLRLEPGTALGQEALARIRAHRGPMMTIAAGPLRERDESQLERFGLVATEPCTTIITSRIDRFLSCDLVWSSSAGVR